MQRRRYQPCRRMELEPLTIATIAMLCYHGRQHLARRLTHDGARLARLTRTLALAGGLILILLGALLWQSDSDITPAPTSNPIGLPR